MNNRLGFAGCGLSVLLLAPALAIAQAWPAKPITMVSGASVGSGGDAAMRAVTTRMAEGLGQPIVVESRRGSGGLEAYAAGAKAEPNGYTLTFVNSGVVTNKFMKKDMPVDATRDYTPIIVMFSTAFFLGAHPSLPANNLKELIDYAKKNPGKLTFASTGIGSAAHLVGDALNEVAGIRVLHVPYAGSNTSLAVNDLLGGRVDMYYASHASFAQHVQAGKLKFIALADDRRSRLAPGVGTFNDVLPDYYNIVVWWGFVGPVGLPSGIVERVRAEAGKVVYDPAMSPRFDSFGVSVIPNGGPESFAKLIRNDTENIGKLVKQLGLKPE
jgi:tripartite-type tricarboxylate transporter receptor subunit TctC